MPLASRLFRYIPHPINRVPVFAYVCVPLPILSPHPTIQSNTIILIIIIIGVVVVVVVVVLVVVVVSDRGHGLRGPARAVNLVRAALTGL